MFNFTAYGENLDLEDVRANYLKAVNDKKICKYMMVELAKGKESPVHQAYLGAFQALWAKHTMNPITKLSTFHKGKNTIEAAIKRDPSAVEIRFIRLSIQKNCPSFLGYDSEIENDKKFVRNNQHTVSSATLKKMIESIVWAAIFDQ